VGDGALFGEWWNLDDEGFKHPFCQRVSRRARRRKGQQVGLHQRLNEQVSKIPGIEHITLRANYRDMLIDSRGENRRIYDTTPRNRVSSDIQKHIARLDDHIPKLTSLFVRNVDEAAANKPLVVDILTTNQSRATTLV